MKETKLYKKIDHFFEYDAVRFLAMALILGILVFPCYVSAISPVGYTKHLKTSNNKFLPKAETDEDNVIDENDLSEGMGGVNFYLDDTSCLSGTKELHFTFHCIETDKSMYVIFPENEISCVYMMEPGTYECSFLEGGNNITQENYQVTTDTFIVTEGEFTDVTVTGNPITEEDKKEDSEDATSSDKDDSADTEAQSDVSALGEVLSFLKNNIMNIIMIAVCGVIILFVKKKKN